MEVGAAGKELVRGAVGVEEVEEIGDGFVFLNPEQVGGSADPQRSQFRQCRTVPELNAEPRQRRYDPGLSMPMNPWRPPPQPKPSPRPRPASLPLPQPPPTPTRPV